MSQSGVGDLSGQFERLQVGQSLEMHQARVSNMAGSQSDSNNLALFISVDLGPEFSQWVRIPTPTPDHPHHQQQTQQTFHVQLLRLAYPETTNIEAVAQRVPATGAEVSSTLLVARKSIQRLSFDGWASDMAAMVAVAF